MNCAYLFSIQYQSNSVPVGWFTSLFGCSAMNSYRGHTSFFSLLTKLNCFPDKNHLKMAKPVCTVHVVYQDILLCSNLLHPIVGPSCCLLSQLSVALRDCEHVNYITPLDDMLVTLSIKSASNYFYTPYWKEGL